MPVSLVRCWRGERGKRGASHALAQDSKTPHNHSTTTSGILHRRLGLFALHASGNVRVRSTLYESCTCTNTKCRVRQGPRVHCSTTAHRLLPCNLFHYCYFVQTTVQTTYNTVLPCNPSQSRIPASLMGSPITASMNGGVQELACVENTDCIFPLNCQFVWLS